MSCIEAISPLCVSDQHCADFLMAPARVCDHFWQDITAQLSGTDNCFLEVAKRIVLVLALVALAPFAAFLGSLSLAIKSCTPLEPQQLVPRDETAPKTANADITTLPTLTPTEAAKNKFKALIQKTEDAFIPQHVAYDETGNIFALGKWTTESAISEELNTKRILFFARPQDAEMVQFSAFRSFIPRIYDGRSYHEEHGVLQIDAWDHGLKTRSNVPPILTARLSAWQDCWGTGFAIPLEATVNGNRGYKMPHKEMTKVVTDSTERFRPALEDCFQGQSVAGIISIALAYLQRPSEYTYKSNTTTFVDRTGGALHVFRPGHHVCSEHPGIEPTPQIYGIRTYQDNIFPGAGTFGYCDECTPNLTLTAEFAETPGIIKVTAQNKGVNEETTPSVIGIDLVPHQRRDRTALQSIIHHFCPSKEGVKRPEALAKVGAFIKEHADLEFNLTPVALFAPRLGIIVINSSQRSTGNPLKHYILGDMTQFAPFIVDPDEVEYNSRPFLFEQRNATDFYLDGEKAEMITREDIQNAGAIT